MNQAKQQAYLFDNNNFDNQIEDEMNRNYQSCPLLGFFNSDSFKNSDFFS